MRFLTTLSSPPVGFETVVLERRILASTAVVLLVRDLKEVSAALPRFTEAMVGCIVTPGARMFLEQLGTGLWHLAIPEASLATGLPVASGVAALAAECSDLAEQAQLAEIKLRRLSSDLVTTREDYNRSMDSLRKKVEQEGELRARLEAFFSINPDLLCLAGVDGYFRRLNNAWLELGYSFEELRSRPFLEFVHPDDVEPTREAMALLASGSDVIGFVNRYRCADGSLRILEWQARGEGDQIFASARDITERKEAEKRQAEMQRQLLHSQKLESLGVLAGGLAHDFNNLMAAVIGNLDLSLMRLPQGTPARTGIERAMLAADRAAELTRQMLAYAGKGQFIIRRFDLNGLLQENAPLLAAIVPKNVSFSVDLAPQLPEVEADAVQVQQVVMNLLTNGAEAIGDQAGALHLSTGSQWCGASYLRRSRLEELAGEGMFVWVEVEDTGCGMDDETQARLFDPFFTTKFTGRGLGMSAVLGIVRSHKGAIMLDTLPGRGTRIRVLLPAAQDAVVMQEGGTSGPCSAESVGFHGLVIVADDEPDVRETCVSMLKDMGFSVLEAAHGVEAVELFRAWSCETVLAVIDLKMPRLDGVRTLERMREIKPEVRVILSSGFGASEIVGTVPGAAGFIQKPYRYQELRRLVTETLRPGAPVRGVPQGGVEGSAGAGPKEGTGIGVVGT